MSLPSSSKQDQRLQAVLALLRGEPASKVCREFNLARSDLYQFRYRALAAMREALANQRRGPKRPHNRLEPQRERQVVSLCQRHPTVSSYRLQKRLGSDAPSPRTIQRVRARNGMARVPSAPLPRRRHGDCRRG